MLTTAEILKKVKELEIISKKITTHLFTGEYHSAFKGKGMSSGKYVNIIMEMM